MWSIFSDLVSKLILGLLDKFAFTKKETKNIVEKTQYSKAEVTSINTFNVTDLVKKYDKIA